jgi:hypothetical protein
MQTLITLEDLNQWRDKRWQVYTSIGLGINRVKIFYVNLSGGGLIKIIASGKLEYELKYNTISQEVIDYFNSL